MLSALRAVFGREFFQEILRAGASHLPGFRCDRKTLMHALRRFVCAHVGASRVDITAGDPVVGAPTGGIDQSENGLSSPRVRA